MALESIKYKRGSLQILNQLQLPSQTVYEEITTVEDGWNAIKQMKVRGAPAIAMVGCLSLVADLHDKEFETSEELITRIENDLEYLVSARPTAVNMKKTADLLITYAKEVAAEDKDPFILKEKIVTKVEYLLEKDVADNKNIGDFGSEHIQDNPDCEKGGDGKVTVLTHCNTGSLATAKYGTALGVIRSLHDSGYLDHVYFTETRPYNQGARLTAYELVHEKIPATLIADSMAALLMKAKTVSAVVVGADRVAMNGDTANKIGTYQLAIAAKHHGIPFYIASPFSSIDRNTKTGEEIVIEERPPEELTYVNGLKIAADGVECWNPAFDVTPYELITGGIITEFGVLKREELLDKLAHTDS